MLLSKVKSDTNLNLLFFILLSIQVISTIKDKAIQFLINSKKQYKNNIIENKNNVFVDIISHGLEKLVPVTSSPQRQYLINLELYQPKLSKFSVNTNIN